MGYISMMVSFEGALAHMLASVAKQCSKKPKSTVVAFFLVAIALTAGMLNVHIESDRKKLWVDQNSLPMENRNYANEIFAAAERENTFVITAKNAGDNVLTMEAFADVFEIHLEMIAAQTMSGKNLSQLCAATASGGCAMSGPLAFWNFDADVYNAAVISDLDLQEACAGETYPTGASVMRQIDFGSFELIGNRAEAAAIRLAYSLEPFSEDGSVAEQFEWEERFLETGLKTRAHVQVFPFAQKSVDEELANAVGNDIPLMGAAYVAMIVFASLTLGKPCGALRGRVLLATTDVFVIIFSAGAAFGLVSICGVPFTSITQILPFILVGIGIDNAYVVSAAFDRTDAALGHPERIYEALSEAGMSITVTSFTDFFAFILASTTKLPALQWFGQYAATAVLFIYIAHITVFPALLTLDARRVESNRRDILPCLHVSGSLDAAGAGMETSSALKAFFEVLGGVLVRPAVKAVVLVVFTGMGAVGMWQATQIENSFDLRLIVPDDSYLVEFYSVCETYFGTVTGLAPFGLYVVDVDFTNAHVQADVRSLSDEVYASGFVDASKGRSDWHLSFTTWAQMHPTWNASLSAQGFVEGSNFAPALQEFLAAFPVFEDSIIWREDDASAVFASRMWFFEDPSDEAADKIYLLDESEELTRSSPLGDQAFMSATNFLTYDQFRIIKSETLTSLLYALLAVLGVAAILLVHPLMVVICGVTVGLVFACILGSYPMFWGISLNAVSAANLIMAISLVVDYCIHIMVTFGRQDPTQSRHDRVRATLPIIGPSVFLAVSTTFIGILPLAAASSEVFRIFFKSFVSIVVFGGAFGLVFLPVLLSLVGPAIPRPAGPGGKPRAHVQAGSGLEL